MGYRSNVEAVIYGPPGEIDRLIAADTLTNKVLAMFEDECQIMRVNLPTYSRPDSDGPPVRIDRIFKVIHARWEDVKWYEGFDDVEAWEQFMYNAPDVAEVEYEFVRVGEEADDVHRTCSDCFEILYVGTAPILHSEELTEWKEN